ncbi:MAG: hypothetical protein ABIK76_03400, partial [candidate division WOR-3 bacterium]
SLFQLLFVCLNFLLAPTPTHAPYQSLANVFLLAAFNEILAIIPYPYDINKFYRSTAIAGGWAGLGFASKQNIGGYTLLAIFFIMTSGYLFYQNKKVPLKLRDFMWPVLSFILVTIITIIPIWLTGGWAKFIEYGFVNKKTYIQLAGIPLTDGIIRFFKDVKDFIFHIRIDKALQLMQGSIFLLPLMVGIGCVVGVLKTTHFKRQSLLINALFMGVGFVGIFPRADYSHLIYAVPTLLIGTIWIIREIWESWQKPRKQKKVISYSVLTIGIFCVLLKLCIPVLLLIQERLVISSLPHFRGPFISRQFQIQTLREMENLKAIGQHYTIFLLTPHAGFYYVLTDINNLTPFDFPLATSFGLNGEGEVIKAIKERSIEAVCWKAWQWRLSPTKIEAFIKQDLTPVSDLKACTLYKLKFSTAY